jgi:hypothetical protein
MEKKRNLWVIPTDKPSNGYILGKCIKELSDMKIGQLVRTHYMMFSNEYFQPQNIYITSDELPKLDEWGVNNRNGVVFKCKGFTPDTEDKKYDRKIILTTDQNLIADGIEQISEDTLLKIIEHINSGKNIESFDEL